MWDIILVCVVMTLQECLDHPELSLNWNSLNGRLALVVTGIWDGWLGSLNCHESDIILVVNLLSVSYPNWEDWKSCNVSWCEFNASFQGTNYCPWPYQNAKVVGYSLCVQQKTLQEVHMNLPIIFAFALCPSRSHIMAILSNVDTSCLFHDTVFWFLFWGLALDGLRASLV